MSLINDALKRASRAQPPSPSPAGPPLTPAEHRPPPHWPFLLVPVLLLGVVIVATWCFWIAARMGRPASNQMPTQRVAAREPAASAEPATSLPFANALRQSAAVAQQISSRQAAAESAFPSVHPSGGPGGSEIRVPGSGLGSPESRGQLETRNPKPEARNASQPNTVAASSRTNPPPLKLKAIFYRPNNPAVLINTKMLFLGDKIGEARVIAIDQESVKLLSHGQTNVLTME